MAVRSECAQNDVMPGETEQANPWYYLRENALTKAAPPVCCAVIEVQMQPIVPEENVARGHDPFGAHGESQGCGG